MNTIIVFGYYIYNILYHNKNVMSFFTGVNEDHSHDHEPPRSDLFLFPDESGNLVQDQSPTYPTLHSPLISPPAPPLLHDSDDFCILDTPGSRTEVHSSPHLTTQKIHNGFS